MIETQRQTLSLDQIEIIKAVLYFDVFNYPLTTDELYENSAVKIPKELYIKSLNELLENNILKMKDQYVLSNNGHERDIQKRKHGNDGAQAIMPKARKYSRKIASFPFVEAVLLSGALSKNYYDEKGDIDFFIITKPNRLWICRTLLILRYKLLPKNKKKYWCTNYFISSDSLEIPDKNAFTGTELAFLIPTINYSLYKSILSKNDWYQQRYPNKLLLPDTHCTDAPATIPKWIFENFFGGKFGKWIDDRLLYVTLKHWQKKYPDLAEEDFELQFRSRKNVCKRHTKGFQNKVLKTWEEKQNEYQKMYKVLLK